MENAKETPEEAAELERLVGWFIQKRRELAAMFFVDSVDCVEGRVIGVTRTVNGRGRVKVKERSLV